MEKSKYSGLILVIIAVIAAIIIFDPFGGKIEGEWYMYYAEMGGEVQSMRQDSTKYLQSYNFSDDGTVTVATPIDGYYGTKCSYKTYTYSYSKGEITMDGTILDCKISGEKMTWSGEVDGTSVKIEFKR